MIAWRPTSWKAMFCAEWRAAVGDRHGGEDALGIGRGPLQHLHPAHRAADDAEELLDAEMVDEALLRPHHVGDGDEREGQAPGLAGRRIDLGRAARSHAAAEHVGADEEIAFGVEHLAGPDENVPPAGLAGDRVRLGDILVAGQGMADEDRVGAVGVELAIGLIGDRIGRQARRRRRAPAARPRSGESPAGRLPAPRSSHRRSIAPKRSAGARKRSSPPCQGVGKAAHS